MITALLLLNVEFGKATELPEKVEGSGLQHNYVASAF